MIVVGVDAHKGVHVAVALDEAGRELSEWRGPNNAAGWRSLIEGGTALPPPTRWGGAGGGGPAPARGRGGAGGSHAAANPDPRAAPPGRAGVSCPPQELPVEGRAR